MERSGWWCNSCERPFSRRVAWWRALPVWRFIFIVSLERRRFSSSLPDASERQWCDWLGWRAAFELPRLPLEWRQLLLPPVADGERRYAVYWS